jgi:hypothetical protein
MIAEQMLVEVKRLWQGSTAAAEEAPFIENRIVSPEITKS